MTTAPFGTWKSPVTSDLIVQDAIHFYEMQADADSIFWTELRPSEKGRYALVRYDGEETSLLLDTSVRTRVHEYGGGAFCLKGGDLIYSNNADNQLYSLKENRKLTSASSFRFADGCGSIWVGENHEGDVQNCLVSIDHGSLRIIASGHDFYSSPRLSPDGSKLAFITWDFPNMQWDSSTLWLADFGADGELHNLKPISGGPDESVCQVQWSPEGDLYFASDKTGFWNLYKYSGGKAQNLCEIEAEFAIPPWVFGMPTYTFVDGKIYCLCVKKGIDNLGVIDLETGSFEICDLPFTSIHSLVTYRDKVYFFGASPKSSKAVICYDPKEKTHSIIKESDSNKLSDSWISEGKLIEFPTKDGNTGYANYYPPKNPNFCAPEGELPPVIIRAHGGPTARAYLQFSLGIQFWTSRGFGFVDVNFGGSTGFGRKYFKRLEGNWGIVDVDDCISVAGSLVDQGLADPDRLLIQGGSSGGYTTLAALAFHNVFAAGTNLFGVSDIEMLCKDTHKFESKYNDKLVASYPEHIDLIRERSPIYHVDKISSPVLILQGDQDTIVLPNQSFKIYEALKKKNIPVGMILFEGEGHGFRKAPNIKRALDAQLYFYSKILGIELLEAYEKPPVEIIDGGS